MLIRARILSSSMIAIILINVISIPFYMMLNSFWFFFASIDKDSNQIENRIKHIFMVVHFLLFQQFYIQNFQFFVEINDPTVIVLSHVF
jgi:hypothetical protein